MPSYRPGTTVAGKLGPGDCGADRGLDRIHDEPVGEILTKAEGTLDIDKRRGLLGELETIMQKDGPIAQPLWRSGYVAYDKRAKNIKLHPTGFIFAEELAIEPA